MSITPTNESQNSASVTNESIADNSKWSEHPESWAGNQGILDAPGLGITKESANSVSVTNESTP